MKFIKLYIYSLKISFLKFTKHIYINICKILQNIEQNFNLYLYFLFHQTISQNKAILMFIYIISVYSL
jgi:hypothetical protein